MTVHNQKHLLKLFLSKDIFYYDSRCSGRVQRLWRWATRNWFMADQGRVSGAGGASRLLQHAFYAAGFCGNDWIRQRPYLPNDTTTGLRYWLVLEARDALKLFGTPAQRLHELADFLIVRNF